MDVLQRLGFKSIVCLGVQFNLRIDLAELPQDLDVLVVYYARFEMIWFTLMI